MVAAVGKRRLQHLLAERSIDPEAIGEEGQRIIELGLSEDGHEVHSSWSDGTEVKVCSSEHQIIRTPRDRHRATTSGLTRLRASGSPLRCYPGARATSSSVPPTSELQ